MTANPKPASEIADYPDSKPLGVAPLALVVLALVGSVAIPARQTWRITDLLRQTTEVLAPSRVIEAQLQSGLAEEMGALQGYALSGDGALLARYHSAVSHDAARLDSLVRLAPRLDAPASAHVREVKSRVDEWRRATTVLQAPSVTPADAGSAARDARAAYEAVMSALTDLSLDLAAGIAERDDRVRGLESWSLIANAVLVLAALGALVAVVALTLRERRALQEARRRARQEGALREAAEALAGAFTAEDVTQMIAEAALKAVEGRGAFVENITPGAGGAFELRVRATAGADVPPLDTVQPFAGSHTEVVTRTGAPMLIENSGGDTPDAAGNLQGTGGPVIVVPLGSLGAPVGALFVLSPMGGHFREDDLARASVFGHLAALAYEKVRLLEEALEGRRKLERVIQSRSRLIRGFSHDVKNPIGAADGYAELLRAGIYGQLSEAQENSINRIRGSIKRALSLIDDLHELGRAETGHLALSLEPLDLGELAIGLGEEFQAAASAGGLSLSVVAEPDLPIIETSVGRVRQIASNLLSNAIKYTRNGSVTLRATRGTGCPLENGECVALEVMDTGSGIPADRQEFIFQEFSRIGDTNKPGAGLGLAISRLLAQALGGQISLESEPGRGSTFTLWLPLHPPPGIAD
jgi:signal transduction histidine kinase